MTNYATPTSGQYALSLDLRLRGAPTLAVYRGARHPVWHLARPGMARAVCDTPIDNTESRSIAQWCRMPGEAHEFCPQCSHEPVALLAIAAHLLLPADVAEAVPA